MKKHTLIGWALTAFIAFYILSSPVAAAGTFTSVLGWCGHACGALVTFLGAVSS